MFSKLTAQIIIPSMINASNGWNGLCEILVHFHPSTLRHFERAHMLAADFTFNLDQSHREDESTVREERCKQWVMSNRGNFPKDMSSWDGSIKYDSGGSTRFDSGSGYNGVLDSLSSCHAGRCCGKLARCLESWGSAQSPFLQPYPSEIQLARISNLDSNGIEAPRSSGESNFEG